MEQIPTKEAWDHALRQRYGTALQRRFASATVAVCGLGGLGSHIAMCLARAGIPRLILIDFDRVDLSNLHRQQYKAVQVGRYKTDALSENLLEAAPYLQMVLHTCPLTPDNAKTLLQDADIICEAFDDAEQKAMLVDVVTDEMPEKYLIAASGMAGLGAANLIKTRAVTNHLILCGDEQSEVSDGLFASRVMLCAAHQAHAVLQLLAQETERKKELYGNK